MSKRGLSDGDLQRYFDGALPSGRAARVRRQLEDSEQDKLRLAALARSRSLLKAAAAESAEEADFEQLWARISPEIAADAKRLEARPAWRLRWPTVSLGLAATAAVLWGIMWFNGPQVAPQRNDCVIESLHVGPETVGTIFTIGEPDRAGETTVIWLSQAT